ncbi:MAG: protein translocase subunit SecD [Dehalococcoidia bacterium]|nr:protein translocase subunit SecD [Dehalococcoidia bacterium]MDW8119193.1 protein translocase subunit SecD [Chloroflexota bacterium]
MNRQDLRRLIIVLIVLALSAVVVAVPRWDLRLGGWRFERGGEGPLGLRLGLDLQGGVQLIYEADVPAPTPDQMEGVVRTIERRVNAFGVTEPVIQQMGSNRVLVQLPGLKEVEEAKRLIGETAKLEFKWRHFNPDGSWEDREVGLTGDDLARAYAGPHPNVPGLWVVNIEFNSRGAGIFEDLTRRIVGTNDQIAIFLDNQELVSPVARSVIVGGRAYIEGRDFTPQRARTIAIQLESGRLPVPVKIVQEQTVDATLGRDALEKSLVAGYIGTALVALFMLLYYRVPGLIAVVALAIYGVVALAIFKVIPVTMTLAGIAGFILSIGMAVDANVLVFERMKEELRAGRTLLAAIEAGFNRAWPSIRDSNISTFITCAILYWFGSRLAASLVVGFAVTLFIGVAVSMFSALFTSRTLLRLVALTPIGRVKRAFVPLAEPAAPQGIEPASRRA